MATLSRRIGMPSSGETATRELVQHITTTFDPFAPNLRHEFTALSVLIMRLTLSEK